MPGRPARPPRIAHYIRNPLGNPVGRLLRGAAEEVPMTGAAGAGTVRLEVDGPIATVTNDNPAKRNAFTDAMDQRLFEVLGELRATPGLRAVIWRGEGHSFSSGRDVSAIGGGAAGMSHHELMTRGHRGIQQLFDLDVPVLVAMQGWAIGASFQRALLCDIRVAADDARFMLPETGHGVIPDTGGVGRLFQICGPGVVSDMVLTGRVMDAAEALAHGVVSRVVPRDELDGTVREMAERIAAAPAVTVKVARRVIAHLAEPEIRSSMAEELIGQTFVNRSDDMAEMRAARAEGRQPRYTGS
ncbi:MAG TPA: enoyl-CoA hydratase/isomerase family protein [Acidimicrobiales bacterium]